MRVPSRSQARRQRALLVSLVLVIVVALGALGGTLAGHWKPKLGLDLAGGLSVTYKPAHQVSASDLAETVSVITNRVDGLDAASLRRFSLKIRFDPLRPDQRVDLFAAIAGAVAPEVRDRLATMDELTAGDFAAALRGLALLAAPVAAETLAQALTEEWTLKRRTARSVHGFRGAGG